METEFVPIGSSESVVRPRRAFEIGQPLLEDEDVEDNRRSRISVFQEIPDLLPEQGRPSGSVARSSSVRSPSRIVQMVSRHHSFTSPKHRTASAPGSLNRSDSKATASTLGMPSSLADTRVRSASTSVPEIKSKLKRSSSFLKRIMKRRVAPTHNLVGSIELILQLNPTHVATDSADRIPIVVDIVMLHGINLSMAGMEQKDIVNQDLSVECCPLYTVGSGRSAVTRSIACLKSDRKPAVLSGDVTIDSQLTMVLSKRLYHQLTAWQVKLCMCPSASKRVKKPAKQSEHVVASCSIDLLYIQRNTAVGGKYDLYYDRQ